MDGLLRTIKVLDEDWELVTLRSDVSVSEGVLFMSEGVLFMSEGVLKRRKV